MRWHAALLVTLAVVVAGCGGGGGDGKQAAAAKPKPDGKALFKANCGVCHALQDAGTKAYVGPDLDNAQPPVAKVKVRVTEGGGIMPSFKGKLSTAEIDAIAQYVNRVSTGPY